MSEDFKTIQGQKCNKNSNRKHTEQKSKIPESVCDNTRIPKKLYKQEARKEEEKSSVVANTTSQVVEPKEIPFVIWPVGFDLEKFDEGTAKGIAKGCQALLYWVTVTNPILSEKFRLQLLPLTKISKYHPDGNIPGVEWKSAEPWVLFLRLDFKDWYYNYLKHDFQQARKFIETFRKIENNEAIPSNIKDSKPSELQAAYCSYAEKCNKAQCKKEKIHKFFKCTGEVRLKGGKIQDCQFKSPEQLLLFSLNQERIQNPYFLCARMEPSRDLILAPMEHLANRDIAVDEKFWMTVFQVTKQVQTNIRINELPWEHIFFNFGLWETQSSQDEQVGDCHGHLHLSPTMSNFEKLFNKFNKQLSGRYQKPNDYIEDWKTLANATTFDQLSDISPKLEKLSSKVEEMSSKIDKLEKLSSKMEEMSSKIDIFIRAMPK